MLFSHYSSYYENMNNTYPNCVSQSSCYDDDDNNQIMLFFGSLWYYENNINTLFPHQPRVLQMRFRVYADVFMTIFFRPRQKDSRIRGLQAPPPSQLLAVQCSIQSCCATCISASPSLSLSLWKFGVSSVVSNY